MTSEWANLLNFEFWQFWQLFTKVSLYTQMMLCFILNSVSLIFMIYSRVFTPINILIINLAIADILYSSCIPYYLRQFNDEDEAVSQSEFGCRLSFILDVTCMIVSLEFRNLF